MSEKKQVFDYETVWTTSPLLAEAYTYLRQAAMASNYVQEEDEQTLLKKLGAVAGLVSRAKTAVDAFALENFGTDLDSYPQAEELSSLFSKVLDQVFILPDNTETAQELSDRLEKADFLSSKLPFLIAALDAGEDLSENKRV